VPPIEAPTDSSTATVPSRRLRRRWLVVDLALVAVVLAALVAVGLTARQTLGDRADDQARAGALAAAKNLAVAVTSMDYRTFDRDATRVVDATAGQLKQQLTTENAALKTAMTTNQATTSGRVLDAAVVDADRDSARVLLVVDADVTNTSTKKPTARHYRIQLDLSRQRGRWLGTNLTFVG
jgi:Mce-associated membrane protein